ncbi:MAG: energy transducer TonB [Rheinheimera sp.]|nr:energy transducer TonB [Rheinheimera sp.]
MLLLLHVGAIAALVQAEPAITAPKPEMEPPKLQGMLIAPEPKMAPPPKAEPEPAKPLPKPPPKQPPLKRTKPSQTTPPPVAKAAAAAPAPTLTKPVTQRAPASSTAKTAEPTTQLPSADAAGLNNKAPVYPMLSRKRKEQGTVWLLLLVSKEGLVSELKLKKTSGFDRLDQAALQAVKKWKFQPARQQGQPIDYWYELPLKFSLQQG